MERKIEIIVQVNNEKHAQLIREEIKQAVRNRTTRYFIGDMENPKVEYSLLDDREEKLLKKMIGK